MPAAGASRALAGLVTLVFVASCAVERRVTQYTGSPAGTTSAFTQASTQIAPSLGTEDPHATGGGPDGGDVYSVALAATRPVTVFASFGQGGVFKSADGGASWAPADRGLPERSLCALAGDPSDSEVVYAHCLDELFKTINGGASWRRLAVDLNHWDAAIIAPSDSRVLYAFPPSSVIKSRDGGRRWAAVVASGLPDEHVNTAEVDPSDSAVVYAGTSGIFKSRDGGTSWTSTSRGLPPTALVEALTIDPSRRDTVYAGTLTHGMFRSTNGGGLWTSISEGLPEDTPIRAVKLSGSTREALDAQVGDRIFRSTDAGDHWLSISDGLPAVVSGGFVADPSSSSTLYAGTHAGVFITTDGGAHWTSANRGVTRMSVHGLVMHAGNPPRLFVKGDAGIFSSTDAGNTWRRVDGAASFTASDLLGIESDRSGGVIAHTKSGYFESVPTQIGWTPFVPRQALADITSLWFAPLDRSAMYGATADGLLTTVDGGRRWSPAGLPGGRVPSQLAISPHNQAVAYAGTTALFEPSRVWRTVNNGGTWEHVDDCSAFIALGVPCMPVFDPNDVNTVYVVVAGVGIGGGGSLIRKTVDGGVTWSELDLPSLALSLTVLPTIPTTLFAQFYDPNDYGRYVLLKSTDRGEQWTASDAGLPAEFPLSSIVADPTNLRHLFAGTSGRGVFRSLDGGATWEPTGARP